MRYPIRRNNPYNSQYFRKSSFKKTLIYEIKIPILEIPNFQDKIPRFSNIPNLRNKNPQICKKRQSRDKNPYIENLRYKIPRFFYIPHSRNEKFLDLRNSPIPGTTIFEKSRTLRSISFLGSRIPDPSPGISQLRKFFDLVKNKKLGTRSSINL